MDLPSCETLDLELDGGWLAVWLNEPERRNPLTGERAAELSALAAALKDRRDIRGVALRGRGGIFCAGGDLKAIGRMATADEAELMRLSREGAAVFDALAALPQLLVGVVEGAAVAGGMGLACCCDLIIAEPSARFSLSEVRVGLVAAQIAPFVQARIGPAETRRMMLLGEWREGEGALAAGLADILCEADEIEAEVAKIRRSLSKCSPDALAEAKSLLAALPHLTREGQIERAAQCFTAAARSADGCEGLAAFAAKRPPNWTEAPC